MSQYITANMKCYIYIIHSEQFPANHYKVGFTVDPKRRISDSSYTTTYVEPCVYKCLWELDTDFNKGRKIEQELHMQLTQRTAYVAGKNKCKEMYKTDLDWLRDAIIKFFTMYHINNTTGINSQKIDNIDSFIRNFKSIENNKYYEKESIQAPDNNAPEIEKIKLNSLWGFFALNSNYERAKTKIVDDNEKLKIEK